MLAGREGQHFFTVESQLWRNPGPSVFQL